jgi:hypothetical protein
MMEGFPSVVYLEPVLIERFRFISVFGLSHPSCSRGSSLHFYVAGFFCFRTRLVKPTQKTIKRCPVGSHLIFST